MHRLGQKTALGGNRPPASPTTMASRRGMRTIHDAFRPDPALFRNVDRRADSSKAALMHQTVLVRRSSQRKVGGRAGGRLHLGLHLVGMEPL
jgi:hypothetical protein